MGQTIVHTGKFYFPNVNSKFTNELLRITNDLLRSDMKKNYGWEEGLNWLSCTVRVHQDQSMQVPLFIIEKIYFYKNIDTVD